MDSKAALVTGAGTRLGSQFALHLAQAGYDIALHCHSSRAAAEAVAGQIREAGRGCELFVADFSADFDATALLADVQSRFPQLVCLINSASVYDAASIANTTEALLNRQFKVNFQAPFFLTRAFAGCVKRKGAQIINILDNKIAYNQFQYSPYLLSKKALADFTKLAAMEFAPTVRINGIAPGVILPMDTRPDDYLAWRSEGIPVQHTGGPNNLLSALSYILENDFVCGQILFVDGGETEFNIGRNAESFMQTPESSNK